MTFLYASTVKDSDGESNMSSADDDNIIDAICGHGEFAMMRVYTLCVCLCVCGGMCAARVCVCDDSVTVCLNVHVRVHSDGV